MKSRQHIRTGKRSTRSVPPEVLDAASMDCVVQMLHGENDLYWHHRIKTVFAEAGIATRRIERDAAHPVWQAWLTLRSFDLDSEHALAI